jgi:hypothetical protein
MQNFLKKHNLDNQSNRKNRKFNIIRYYPKIQTYEFINVGIILYDNDKVLYRLLKEEEISKLHCSGLISSKILKNSLNSLDEYLQNRQSLKDAIDNISNRYKNILDTSFQLIHSSDEKTEELVSKLFYDYIGYKFDDDNKETKLEKLIKKTRTIVTKEYKNHLDIRESKIHGYSLDFFNKKTQQIHHSLLGSIENSENIARAFLNVPSNISNHNYYDFLNTKLRTSTSASENRKKLTKLQINVYDYTGEDDIANYCEKLLKV